jgi:transcriptional regulator with XRE-family HTH domain
MASLTMEEMVRSEVEGLGARIRQYRLRNTWTLDELAKRSTLSKSYLSRVEDGERQPSIAALLSLARAFGVPVAELFASDGREENRCTVVRSGSATVRQGNGLAYAVLSSGARPFGIQPIRVTVPANREGDELYRHEGEEWLYVLSGTLRLILADEIHDLSPGDAAHFDAGLPHRLTALGGQDVELILVASAGPRRLLSSYL